MHVLAESLLKMRNLTTVDFSDNALNPGGAEAIRNFLENCLTLKTLRLNNTGVGPAGGEVSRMRQMNDLIGAVSVGVMSAVVLSGAG